MLRFKSMVDFIQKNLKLILVSSGLLLAGVIWFAACGSADSSQTILKIKVSGNSGPGQLQFTVSCNAGKPVGKNTSTRLSSKICLLASNNHMPSDDNACDAPSGVENPGKLEVSGIVRGQDYHYKIYLYPCPQNMQQFFNASKFWGETPIKPVASPGGNATLVPVLIGGTPSYVFNNPARLKWLKQNNKSGTRSFSCDQSLKFLVTTPCSIQRKKGEPGMWSIRIHPADFSKLLGASKAQIIDYVHRAKKLRSPRGFPGDDLPLPES